MTHCKSPCLWSLGSYKVWLSENNLSPQRHMLGVAQLLLFICPSVFPSVFLFEIQTRKCQLSKDVIAQWEGHKLKSFMLFISCISYI